MPADKEFHADIFQKNAAQWTAENPFLSENDLCIESDTGKMKVGTGQRWADTAYIPSEPASLAWDNVTDKPAEFPPGSHTHAPDDITTETTYTNFLPEGGDLATAYSGIDSAISGKASLDDDVSFTSITFAGNYDNTLEYDLIQMSLLAINCTQGIVLGAGMGITFPDSSVQTTAGAALGHQHWVAAPATASSTGTVGSMAYDSSYFYICTATDTWRRIAHDTWT